VAAWPNIPIIGEVSLPLVDTALRAAAGIHAGGVAQHTAAVVITRSMAVEAVTMVVAEATMVVAAIVANAPLD